ncbi:hypothetical protein [Ktedonobacter racemifer]|uniref:Uncharacterized protein n=1 Tax=Ktedonobacter racemifer DSM 44963 TaxID=485913 RepID=D6U8D2_KTERA|nr:hypothetical protein [Ktedonobacter racemifer]EFH80143.1 hypothetical protein Krac_0704 [Ktedonobacter racemifer DSM 44963]
MKQKPETYMLVFQRSMTFRNICGDLTFVSSGEIVPGVELLQEIPAMSGSPAIYELAMTLDGEHKVLIVLKSLVILCREQSPKSSANKTKTTHAHAG